MTLPYVAGGILEHARGPAPQFDPAIAALTPDAWWNFQDSSFSSQIADVSGNGRHLVSQTTLKASAAPALRSVTGITQSGRVFGTGWSYSDFSSDCSQYRTASSTALASLVSGQTKAAIQIAAKVSPFSISVGDSILCGLSADPASVSGELFDIRVPNATKQLTGKCKNAANNSVADTSACDDSTSHIWTFLCDDVSNWLRCYKDGTQVATTSAYTFDGGLSKYFWLMARGTNTSYPTWPEQLDIDHIAIWGGANTPSVSEITDMHDKWIAERV